MQDTVSACIINKKMLNLLCNTNTVAHTAKTKYRNFEINIPRKGISGPQSQFPHSCACERFRYAHHRSPYSAGGICTVYRSWDYINRSQTHECWNWGWGRAIHRKGIYKWDSPCNADIPFIMIHAITCTYVYGMWVTCVTYSILSLSLKAYVPGGLISVSLGLIENNSVRK